MKRLMIAAASLVAMAGLANAASIVNNDSETRTVVVSEGSSQTEVTLDAGEATDFCPNGCFVTMQGERETLLGTETLEISNGRMRLR